MSVKKEANGRRSISVEVEVPGTPEEVWDAIATGPGISKWFVPAQVEPHVGGKLVLNFALGRRSQATTDAFIEGLRHATAHQRFQISVSF